MRKLYLFLVPLLAFYCASAQYQVNGSAISSPSSGYANEFQLVPPAPAHHIAGSVFNTTSIDLSKDFEIRAELFFGAEDENGGDGIALVFQNEGASYLGNYGAGLGYHRFDTDVPGPVPSFIVEFDTYRNDWIAIGDIMDPAADHLGFMSNSNAYHSNAATALSAPYEFSANVEDGAWHPVIFSWNASTKTMTVTFTTTVSPLTVQTFTYSGDIVSNIFSGNKSVLWGFTASTGHASTEHRVRIVDYRNGPAVTPISIDGQVINVGCRGGSVDITVTGGTQPYSFLWSNGATTGNISNVPAGAYTVTVTDAKGVKQSKTFNVANDGCAVTPLAVTGVVTNASCSSQGAINLTVSGGKAPYTFKWSNSKTTEDISGLAAGTYKVTVKDAAGTIKEASFNVTTIADVTAPQVSCAGTVNECYNLLFGYYKIPEITATDNCGIGSISYVITGATSRSGTGEDASGLFNPGISTITWKVKDKSGNSSTCVTTVKINKVVVTIPDVITVSQGGKANTIYMGYGPSSVTLTANPSGGTAPYTYLWSTGATSQSISFNGTKAGTYTFVVVVRDATGCVSLMAKQIKVKDIRCGNNKVVVCHIPSGNVKKSDELCVSVNAVPAHLQHGDKLGTCDNDDEDDDWFDADRYTGNGNHDNGRSIRSTPANIPTESASATVYPNPSSGTFDLTLKQEVSAGAQVLVINANGLVVEKRNLSAGTKAQSLHFDLRNRASGVYLIKIVTPEGTQTQKIVVQR